MDIDPPTTATASTSTTITTITPDSAAGQEIIRPRLLLEEAIIFKSDAATARYDWRRTGSPIYHIDERSKTIISASMVMRPTTKGGNWLDDYQILIYTLPDLTNPLAILTSDSWTKKRDDGEVWNYPHQDNSSLSVAQIMDIRHYPTVNENGEMRVVMVVAFGENARPIAPDQEDAHVLDVWLIVKIVEIWLPVASNTALTSNSGAQFALLGPNSWPQHSSTSQTPMIQPRYGRVETIEPSQNQNFMRGRIAKLYVAKAPKIAGGAEGSGGSQGGSQGEANEEYDCITLFGMLQSETSPALVIKKILFLEDKKKELASWSKKQISRGVSCELVSRGAEPCISKSRAAMFVQSRNFGRRSWE
ncbi:hypothetical protein BGZ58_002415 [Dissophora ornata]|nr:hypothetical protein BGZ58_002415 [Dissophora ornata]